MVILGNVDPDGNLRDISCGASSPENICKAIKGVVAGWQFRPGTREGKPSAMDINLNLGVVALPQEKGYSLQVTEAKLSPRQTKSGPYAQGRASGQPAPVYPPDEMISGREGVVDLEILLQPSTTKTTVGKIWFNGKEAGLRNSFVRSAINSVKTWNFSGLPPEQISTCVPIEFIANLNVYPDPNRKSPCTPRYVEGFALPELLTKVGTSH